MSFSYDIAIAGCVAQRRMHRASMCHTVPPILPCMHFLVVAAPLGRVQVAGRALAPAAALLEAAAACGAMLQDTLHAGAPPALARVSIAAALLLPRAAGSGAGAPPLVDARVRPQTGAVELCSAPSAPARRVQHFAACYSNMPAGASGARRARAVQPALMPCSYHHHKRKGVIEQQTLACCVPLF